MKDNNTTEQQAFKIFLAMVACPTHDVMRHDEGKQAIETAFDLAAQFDAIASKRKESSRGA